MKLIAIILTAIPLLAQLPEFGSSPGGGGGSGTVEAITATCGLNTADGAAITISGSIKGSRIVNAQTGTSYAIQNSDCGKLLTISNGAAIALSIAQAGTGGFDAGWYLTIRNLGAGTATITPATSTINGAATLAIVSGRSAEIYSDGTNYQVAGASAFAEADVARLSVTNVFAIGQAIERTEGIYVNVRVLNYSGSTTASSGFSATNTQFGDPLIYGTILRSLGTGWTTNGALKQDGGILNTGSAMTGGLSIAAETGDMRFYRGGIADANLMGGFFGSSICLGPENAACSGTLEIQNAVATTGSTNVSIVEGAGQSGNSFQIFASNGSTNRFSVSSAGAVVAASSINSGASIIAASSLEQGAAGILTWNTRSKIRSGADGSIQLGNSGNTDFGLLQFGGATSSFPALKRSTTDLQLRLADDSGFTSIQGLYKSSDGSAGVTVATCSSFKDGLCVAGS